AKIEAGRATLDIQSFDVVRTVQDNIDMMRARCREKGIELILKTSPTVPRFIRSDPGRFRQVLINLLGNAVKFTERGSVTVRLNAANAMLILEVEDTGIGI